MQVNMHEAKSQLSKLVEKALRGEEVIIAKGGKPYVKLIPFKEQHPDRIPGGYEGQFVMTNDFDETPAELNALFEGQDKGAL